MALSAHIFDNSHSTDDPERFLCRQLWIAGAQAICGNTLGSRNQGQRLVNARGWRKLSGDRNLGQIDLGDGRPNLAAHFVGEDERLWVIVARVFHNDIVGEQCAITKRNY